MQTTFFILAALIYSVCAFLPARLAKAIAIAVLCGWIFHGFSLWSEIVIAGALRVGFAIMLSAALWVSVLVYWLENQNFSLDGLRLLVFPSAAIAVLLPLLFPGNIVSLDGKSTLFLWHIAVAVAAYSTLTIAAFHAVLMVIQESRLHAQARLADSRWFVRIIDRLPALLTMEKLLFRMIFIGFILLTLTVLSGIVFSEQLFGKALTWNHKTIFALLSWLLFGVLLLGRYWRGWRGKAALRLTMAGFVTLLLAYVGSRFVLEVILHRGLA